MIEKNLEYYMKLPYGVEVTPDEDSGGFNAAIPLLRGCMASGETVAEAYEVLTDIKRAWFEIALERGWHIPEPQVEELKEYSGKFNIRIPRYLHRELAQMADREGTSLNQLVVSFLAEGAERQRQRDLSGKYISRTWFEFTKAIAAVASSKFSASFEPEDRWDHEEAFLNRTCMRAHRA